MDDVIAEQIAYYRARAGEYDRWWQRSWAHDKGPEAAAVWTRDVETVTQALEDFTPRGRILELACGTGWWTQTLARYADELVAVDASPETIEIARGRAPDTRFVVADIFTFEPTERFDIVFFSFWLSHVPVERSAAFWSMVDRALAPGGRVFFIDNLGTPSVLVEEMRPFLDRDTSPDGVVTRKLYDGTPYRAVKVYYEPDELESRLRELGWKASVSATEAFFYWGSAQRMDSRG